MGVGSGPVEEGRGRSKGGISGRGVAGVVLVAGGRTGSVRRRRRGRSRGELAEKRGAEKRGKGNLGLHFERVRGLAWCGEGRWARRDSGPGIGCGVKDWSLEGG